MHRFAPCFLSALLLCAGSALAEPKLSPAKLYDEVTPSLVAVQYSWVNELNRQDLINSRVNFNYHPQRQAEKQNAKRRE